MKHLAQPLALRSGLWAIFRIQPDNHHLGLTCDTHSGSRDRQPRLRATEGTGRSARVRPKVRAFPKPSEPSCLPAMQGTTETQSTIITSERKTKVPAHKTATLTYPPIRPCDKPVPWRAIYLDEASVQSRRCRSHQDNMHHSPVDV